MAYRIESNEYGYDESRFESPVRKDFLCSICREVPKDPRICQNKDHVFCSAHILRHLQNSQTCPVCREPLTPGTLKRPSRFFMNCLKELHINCDYNQRGCPDYVELGNLQRHVDQCGYAPVMCGNEGCGMEIRKKDKESHEKDLCRFKITKCHDCRGTKETQDEIKARQRQMEAAQDEMKRKLNETNVKIAAIERKQDQINLKVNSVKENVGEMKQAQAEMKHEFEKMSLMIIQLLQGANVNIHGAQALDPAVPVHSATNQDIIILGGWYGEENDAVLITVEKFNIVEGKSAMLPVMNQPRAESAACVYNNDVIVTGGYDGHAGTDTIEILKMKHQFLVWTLLDGKLPVRLHAHAVIFYQGKLFVIGGYDWNEKKTSNAIYQVYLRPPYTFKLLVRMPQPRQNHRVELVNDQLFIFGGSTSSNAKDAIDSVVLYDISTNVCKARASLRFAVWGMSSITWGNMILVIGGEDKNGQVLDDVIMYDTETGETNKLPSMISKREDCSAVIMNDVVVVMGGWNREQGCLNTVETFTIGSDGWKELPSMKAKRRSATAVLSPGN